MLTGFFTRILTGVRDWIDNMLNVKDISKIFDVDIAMDPSMVVEIEKWYKMYRNVPPWKGEDNGYVKTLNLPAVISSKIAGNVTVEMNVKLSGSTRAAYLQTQLNKMLEDIQNIVELGNALGGIMIKPYPSNGSISFDYVQANQFYPVSYDADKNITGCIFVDRIRKRQLWFTRLEYHQLENNGIYIVENRAFRSNSNEAIGSPVPLQEVEEWKDFAERVVLENIISPLFGYFKTPVANTIDTASPLGVACFSKAVDLIEQADRAWSDFLWELDSGKRAIYADPTVFPADSDGNQYLANKRLYRKLHFGNAVGDSKQLFEDFTPTIRQQEYLDGLDGILKRIELNTGLAFGSLVTNPSRVEMTATEIKSSRQETFLTITNTQKSVQRMFDNLVYAIDVLATIMGFSPEGSITTTYEFDDSIVTDHDTQFNQDMQVTNTGKMPKYVFLMRNYGLSKAEAQRWIKEVQDEAQAEADLLGFDEGT